MPRMFLIFSGHNDRAVLALCRALSKRKVDFMLVAGSKSDSILRTTYSDHVAFIRNDHVVDLSLFEKARLSISPQYSLVYCPTTEFINSFVLDNRQSLRDLDIEANLPSIDVYNRLTQKSTSPDIVKMICGLSSPSILPWTSPTSPCVFKPKSNILQGIVHYPILCFDNDEATHFSSKLDPNDWFVQQYVEGQSHYICAYLSRGGSYHCYWQTNLMQQPNGKSIVLARLGSNPGIDEVKLFRGLSLMGFWGPIMMEIIEASDGHIYFIELNPRFWGPLQLGVDACPGMLDLFIRDAGFDISEYLQTPKPIDGQYWYAWAEGAEMPGCRIYPAAKQYDTNHLQILLRKHDIFTRGDL